MFLMVMLTSVQADIGMPSVSHVMKSVHDNAGWVGMEMKEAAAYTVVETAYCVQTQVVPALRKSATGIEGFARKTAAPAFMRGAQYSWHKGVPLMTQGSLYMASHAMIFAQTVGPVMWNIGKATAKWFGGVGLFAARTGFDEMSRGCQYLETLLQN